MRPSILLPAFILLSGCAAVIEPLAWPGPTPHLIALHVDGNEADPSKELRCRTVAEQTGVTLVDNFPFLVQITLAGTNRLRIYAGDSTIHDEEMPSWSTTTLCEYAMRVTASKYQIKTARDIIEEIFRSSEAMRALAAAAEAAQAAYNLQADTGINESRTPAFRAQMVKSIDAAQDSFRKFSSYGSTISSSTFDLRGKGVIYDSARDARASIRGKTTIVRTEYADGKMTIMAIDSDRGKTIFTFDANMRATPTKDFERYLVGDVLEVGGSKRERIDRGDDASTASPTPATPTAPEWTTPNWQEAPRNSGGCSNDNDCKGDRICERGTCVTPHK